MARVQIIDHLQREIRSALEDAVREVLPQAEFDGHDLFRAFSRAVGRRCGYSEHVPDSTVRS